MTLQIAQALEDSITPEIAQALLVKKIDALNTIANTSTLWWVSAVVFCATLLGVIWTKKDEVRKLPFRTALGSLLYVFFASIVAYGTLVTGIVLKQYLDVRYLLGQMTVPLHMFDAEYIWALVGIPIGTSSFVIFLIVWRKLWKTFYL